MRLIALLALLGLVACQSGGPSTSRILSDSAVTRASTEDIDYVVIEPDLTLANRLSEVNMGSDVGVFIGKGRSAPIVIGQGDLLEVAIVSTSSTGFIDFSQNSVSPVSATDLPPQVVGSDGMINVPPLGRVLARGKSVQQFEAFLARRLAQQLVEPSVIVRLSDRRSASVSVLGQVNSPGVFPINANNGHLIEMLAEAGGPLGSSRNLVVSLSRAGRTSDIRLSDLYGNSDANVHMRDGDVISVEVVDNAFTFLGAGAANAKIDFPSSQLSLAEGIGQAGGLLNRRADRRGVFVFRIEDRIVLETLGVDVSKLEGERLPVVYRFDARRPDMIFLASAFNLRNDDVVYVSDSPVENINAVLSAVTAVVPAPVEYVRAETIN